MTATYDTAGNLTAVLRADGTSASGTYDGAGHLVHGVDGQGNATTLERDAAGNVTRAIDALGNSTRAQFDTSGRLTSLTDAAGATTTYTYTAAGQLHTVTDARGAGRTSSYDALGRLVSYTDPLGTTALTYDTGGRMASVVAPNGTSTYRYDVDNNLISTTAASGEITTFATDPLGRLTQVSDPVSDIHRAYDAAGQMLSESTQLNGAGAPPPITLAYTYGPNGGRTSRLGPDGTTRYTYDRLGRLTAVTDSAGGVFALAYDAASRPTQMTRPRRDRHAGVRCAGSTGAPHVAECEQREREQFSAARK